MPATRHAEELAEEARTHAVVDAAEDVEEGITGLR